MEKLKALFFLCRPWSLTATAVPFMVFVFAFVISSLFDESIPKDTMSLLWSRLGLAFIAASALQITCNLLNTWGDNKSGVDDVPGAHVTTPQIMQGYVTTRQVFILALAFLAVTVSIGLYLSFKFENGVLLVNWSLLGVGLIGVLGASNYATLLKFKYHGLGTPFVFFLMGPVFYMGIMASCVGFEFLQVPFKVHIVTALLTVVVSLPVASLVSVILFGNDMRDRLTDAAAGIKTMATILRPRRTLVLFWVLHIYPYVHYLATVSVVSFLEDLTLTRVIAYILPFLVLPLTLKALRRSLSDYRKNPENPYWFGFERESGKIHFIFGILYSLAVALLLAAER
jgi:1,4-dihydroxy-2-naphthoate octaprenyltransferase